MKVILCGYHWIGCKVLEFLINQGHEVFVYTHQSPFHIPSLELFCEKRKINYSLDNISDSRLPFKPDIICSVYYRNIIKSHVIESCGGKIFNLHPALLPKYRGCSSLTWAMINGEKEVGFTYHYIDNGCDTGNIILQKKIMIEEFDNQLTLFNRVMFQSFEYFNEAFKLVVENYSGEKQLGEVSFYKRGCPYSGEINPDWDDKKIERFIRAMYFPPYPLAQINGIEVKTFAEYVEIKNRLLELTSQ